MTEVGLGVPPGSGAETLDAAGVAALLQWWNLAGVDTPTADVATAWLAPEQQPAAPDSEAGIARPAPREPLVRQPLSRPLVAARPDPVWDSFESLEALTAKVRADHPRIPFADGNPASGLMILGEAPSADDLQTGRPFSGPAGQFLDRMLAAVGLDRGGCYIALLCPRARRPGTPADPDDIAADLALTRAHIRLMAPRHILLLGANPVQALTGTTTPISRVRGSWLQVDAGPGAGGGPIPALATFNPAYLLRRPAEKARAWADLLALKHRLSQ